MPKVRRLIQFDPELLERIDAVRGDVPFAAWVRRMCEAMLPLEEKRVAAMKEWDASVGEIRATFTAHDSASPALKTLASKVEALASEAPERSTVDIAREFYAERGVELNVPKEPGAPIPLPDEAFEFSAADLEQHRNAIRNTDPQTARLAMQIEGLKGRPIPCQCGGVIYQSGSKKGQCSRCSAPKEVRSG